MTAELNIERILVAHHMLTGAWMSGDQARRLVSASGSRDELLAHGIIDLGWLNNAPAAREKFAALAAAAMLGSDLAEEDDSVPYPAAKPVSMSKDEALELLAKFAEDPVATDPKLSLRRLAESVSDQVR